MISFYQEISIHVLVGFVNKGFLFATSSWKIKSHVVESQVTLLVWLVYHFHFLVLEEPGNFGWTSVFLLFFQILGSFFVLVTIIIFDLALHICIYIIHAEYFWLIIAGLTEKFYTLILKFEYIAFCLLTEPRTVLRLKILVADLILL